MCPSQCPIAGDANVVIGVTVKVDSHCRSDQLDCPDHPNSPTKFDRSSFRRLVPNRVCSCMVE